MRKSLLTISCVASSIGFVGCNTGEESAPELSTPNVATHPESEPTSSTGPKIDASISVSETEIRLNDSTFTPLDSLEALTEVLGQPDRTSDGDPRDYWTWDNLGIVATGKETLTGIRVQFNAPGIRIGSPRGVYTKAVTIVGTAPSSSATLDAASDDDSIRAAQRLHRGLSATRDNSTGKLIDVGFSLVMEADVERTSRSEVLKQRLTEADQAPDDQADKNATPPKQ